MTSLDVGIAALRSSLTALRSSVAALPSVAALRAAADRGYELYDRSSATLKSMMPKGLYARALLIIIAPMVVLQSVVASCSLSGTTLHDKKATAQRARM